VCPPNCPVNIICAELLEQGPERLREAHHLAKPRLDSMPVAKQGLYLDRGPKDGELGRDPALDPVGQLLVDVIGPVAGFILLTFLIRALPDRRSEAGSAGPRRWRRTPWTQYLIGVSHRLGCSGPKP
jgi:hypothetical protein